jgi:hypothetical protein
VYSGNGSGSLTEDGNIQGGVWGGYLSNWLNTAIGARAPIRNGNGGYGYVVNDSGNKVNIQWQGSYNDVFVDGNWQGWLVTHNNGGNFFAPRSSMDFGGVGSYTMSTQYHQPAQNGLYNLSGFGGTWRCMGPGLGGSNNDALYVRIS